MYGSWHITLLQKCQVNSNNSGSFEKDRVEGNLRFCSLVLLHVSYRELGARVLRGPLEGDLSVSRGWQPAPDNYGLMF